jgi:hypothetical protein
MVEACPFFVVLSEAKDLAVVVPAMMPPVNHQRRQSWIDPPQGPSLRSGRRERATSDSPAFRCEAIPLNDAGL